MGIFKNYKIADVKVFGSGKYFREGEYIVELNNVKFNSGHKGEAVIIEGEVLAVQSSDEEVPEVGQNAAHVIKLSGGTPEQGDMGLSNLKQFVAAACEIDVDDKNMDDADWDALITSIIENNDLKGVKMRLSCFIKITKVGNPFTIHNWMRPANGKDLAKFGLKE